MAKPVKEVRISPDPVSPEPCPGRARRESPRAALRNNSVSSGECLYLVGINREEISFDVFYAAGRRTAMGEYVPPPGGRPLSSQGKYCCINHSAT